jgi:hypothetical protein
MSRQAIQIAIDILQQSDTASFYNWSQQKQKALATLHRAHEDYEYELFLARTKGVVATCGLFTAVNVVAVGLLAWYLGWV